MTRSLRLYRTLNILSIDVVAGTLVGALFFGNLLQVKILPYALASLGITVWIIYTTDHLWDAKKIKGNASSERHAFHQRHARTISNLLVAGVIIDFALLFYIHPQVLLSGIFLSALVGLYLIFQHRVYFLKEILVAAMYILGILIPSIVINTTGFDWPFKMLAFQYYLISLLNLLLFSMFDEEVDGNDKFGSFVTKFGRQRTQRIIHLIFFLIITLNLLQLIFWNFNFTFLVPLAMTLALMWIYNSHGFFSQNERFRLAGDAVFFLPILYLLWAHR